MTRDDVYNKVNDNNYKYDKSKLLNWIRSLPNIGRLNPNKHKRGDVFMHPIFMHPYILTEEIDGGWVCLLLTSNGEFEGVVERCESRFFYDSYITETLFISREVVGTFIGVYDNNRHLTQAIKRVRKILI